MDENEFPTATKMFGIELEFFLLNKEGKIVNEAEKIIQNLKSKLTETEIKQECGLSMIEVTSFPHIYSREIFDNFFNDFESLLYEIEMDELGLYYYGSYPGKNDNIMREDKRYFVKSEILGQEEFKNAGRCIGFHFHYSLPKNSFNPNINFFYPDIKPVIKNKVLNLFNLYIALDPAVITLMQSSPYYEGKLIGKDARIIAYRGDELFNFSNALYSKQPDFGTLNEYSTDFDTLLQRTMDRTSKWKNLLRSYNMNLSDFSKKDDPSLLDSSWKPVKISPHATIESRGADMNSISKVIAFSSVMKTLSKYVEDNSVEVIPSEIGNEEPFKLEDKRLYVPTHDKLKILQKNSAFKGFEDKEVFNYSKSLMDTVKRITSIEMHAPLRIFMERIDERKTASDYLIDYVKKKQGYTDEIEDETAKNFALLNSEKIYKELLITKKMTERNIFF